MAQALQCFDLRALLIMVGQRRNVRCPYGVCTVSVRCLYGVCTVSLSMSLSMSVVCPWYVRGMSVVCPWYVQLCPAVSGHTNQPPLPLRLVSLRYYDRSGRCVRVKPSPPSSPSRPKGSRACFTELQTVTTCSHTTIHGHDHPRVP